MQGLNRDRDDRGRPRNARPRDALGRPQPREPLDAVDPARVAPDPPALPPPQALRVAQELLDAGRPFEAHEVLEAVWKATAGADRALWRGLAQLAVGATHAARGNPTGAAALLSRAATTLAPYAGAEPHGVAVDALRAWATDGGTAVRPRLVADGSGAPGQAADDRA